MTNQTSIQAQDFVDQVKPLSAKQRQEINNLFVKKMKVTGSVPKEYKELIEKEYPDCEVFFERYVGYQIAIYAVNEHFEQRTTKKSARVGGFAKPSTS